MLKHECVQTYRPAHKEVNGSGGDQQLLTGEKVHLYNISE